jgi:ribosome-binding factor A
MSNRLLRVNELLQREISSYLHRHYTSEAVGITITGVEITGDLREAKVFFSLLDPNANVNRTGRWLLGIRNELREHIAKHVVIRHVPLLAFVHDNHAPRALRIEELLGEIEEQEKKKKPQS